jgi:hypothetical protein
MPAKCRFCDSSYPDFESLRAHARKRHPEQFMKIKQWIRDTVDWRLESAELDLRSEGGNPHA